MLVERADRILTPFEPPLSERARAQLEDLGVEVRTGVSVDRSTRPACVSAARLCDAGTVLWGAGVRPSPLAAALGVPLDRAGRVVVGADCAVPDHPELFVIGDMASFTPDGTQTPLPGISPVAIQEARAGRAQHPRRSPGPAARSRFVTSTRASWRRSVARAPSPSWGGCACRGLIAWLAWVFVHLWYLVGFRNRVVVFTNWIWAYVISRHGARVITGRGPPGPGR